MRRATLALALCLLAHAVSAATLQSSREQQRAHLDPAQQPRARAGAVAARRTRSSEHWLSLISNLAHIGATNELEHTNNRAAASVTSSNVILPPPIKIDGSAGTTSLQLVLIPIPMPAQCPQQPSNTLPYVPAPVPSPAGINPINVPHNELLVPPAPSGESVATFEPAPRDRPRPGIRGGGVASTPAPSPGSPPDFEPGPIDRPRPFTPDRGATRTPAPPRGRRPLSSPPAVEPSSTTGSRPPSRPDPPTPAEVLRARITPYIGPVDNSQQLLAQFRAQTPRTPWLPPVVVEPLVITAPTDEVVDVPDPAAATDPGLTPYGNAPRPPRATRERPQDSAGCLRTCSQRPGPDPVYADQSPAAPPLPRFDRSMKLTAILTVPHADYSEPYTLWWDAASGASRIDHHGDTASSYRIMRPGATIQSVHMRRDRTGAETVRRCLLMAPRRVALAERALPVLPDLSAFKFAGYIEAPPAPGGVAARVERWRHAESAQARGEVLTFRHELLVVRARDNFTTAPLRYAVAVDSSILGPNSDAYIHRFLKVFTRHQDSSVFHLDIGDACDQIENTERIELAEPLREFAMLQRDPMYDGEFQRYKGLYRRQYADDLEDTVRKNLLIQSFRFVSSGNRKGASFEMELGFLADRLAVERKQFTGVEFSSDNIGDRFPHNAEQLRNLRGRMPRTFDWRDHGAVTSVRNQSTCPSCWAFSVVGSVEGALFRRTGRLVALSEQVLLDCGHKTKAGGCNPTWPKKGFDYVRQYGLPALDEYYPYEGKVQQCEENVAPIVTRISSFVNVTSRNVLALKVAIWHHGPTVVLMDAHADSLVAHKSGFYHDAKCKKTDSNHAMLAVGWTVHRGETYFILKNSWTAGWGEGGYISVRGATNTCGILRVPMYPLLAKRDVQRVPASALSAAATPPHDFDETNNT